MSIFNASGNILFQLTNDGVDDGLVVKYNSSGTPLWVRKIGGSLSDSLSRVSTDSSGNIIALGNYTSDSVTIYAADGTSVFTTLFNDTINELEVFVVKYDSSGTPLWATRLGGTLSDFIVSIFTDSSGNIIVVGWYSSNPLRIYAPNGTVSFVLTNANTDGSSDMFIVKYNSNGTPLWARRMNSTGSEQSYSGSTDSSGNIIVTGWYSSTLGFY